MISHVSAFKVGRIGDSARAPSLHDNIARSVTAGSKRVSYHGHRHTDVKVWLPRKGSKQDTADDMASSCTGFKKLTAVYTWTLEDFSLHPKEEDRYIESEPFSTTDSNHEWALKLYPYRCGNVSASFTLRRPYNATAEAKLWIVDEKKLRCNVLTLDARTFTSGKEEKFGSVVGRKDLFDVSKGLLPDDTLTLCCEVTVLCPTTERGPGLPAATLQDDIGRLLQSEDHSDFVLVAGEKEFHVHKVILAARSPVFRAMFQHDTKERSENRATIEDLSPKVMEEMLRYVYTDAVENLGTLMAGLLQAAVKYDIPGLRSLCETHIWRGISVKNAVDAYRLADKHDLNDLKERVARFIERNSGKVAGTEGWKKALQEDPGVLESLYCRRCDQVKRKAE